MGFFARAARFLVLLQIALFVISAVIISGPVCNGARPGLGGGALDPGSPVCVGGRCAPSGQPYTRPGCGTVYKCPPGAQP
uniref:Predicted protein n=1 Tax=Hordeum vulgare subsp. vulgare TaxID=112509 RepID=F2CQ49_HORVV|nr:predicted protein [Hordeum vulgare subsp. vulgare]